MACRRKARNVQVGRLAPSWTRMPTRIANCRARVRPIEQGPRLDAIRSREMRRGSANGRDHRRARHPAGTRAVVVSIIRASRVVRASTRSNYRVRRETIDTLRLHRRTVLPRDSRHRRATRSNPATRRPLRSLPARILSVRTRHASAKMIHEAHRRAGRLACRCLDVHFLLDEASEARVRLLLRDARCADSARVRARAAVAPAVANHGATARRGQRERRERKRACVEQSTRSHHYSCASPQFFNRASQSPHACALL